MEKIKCLIIGSGPAGYTAAIYTARAGLKPVVYAGLTPGGQLTTTSEVENFPGYPDGVNGTVMMDDLRRQAERFGADIRQGEITSVGLSVRPFRVTTDESHQIEAESIIVATGATALYLGLPSESRYIGMGVSACAVCDGFFYRGRDVAVVGGGDSACEEALYLSTLCRQVYLVVRKPFLRASKHMQRRVFETSNIEVLFEHTTQEVLGDESGVTGARLGKADGTVREIAIEGFFPAIGHSPRTEIFRGQLRLDPDGYILTGPAAADPDAETDSDPATPYPTSTSVRGVFAAGDVADRVYQQAITAAAAGCRAALDCERFLLDE
ncbi:MAG: thioredoxin-disulfide reductase [Alistipes sp.]|jgi:thioredoxin reductase (NADPH)|nr:thioredoxin-disulfide reductase [Alistipes sp.]